MDLDVRTGKCGVHVEACELAKTLGKQHSAILKRKVPETTGTREIVEISV